MNAALHHHLDAIGRELAAAKAAAGQEPGGPALAGPAEPTQVSALHAAAMLAAVAAVGEFETTFEVDRRAKLGIRLYGSDGAQLAAVTAYTTLLENLRNFWTADSQYFQIYITADYPGTRSVELVACLDAEPDTEILARLRELAGTGSPGVAPA